MGALQDLRQLDAMYHRATNEVILRLPATDHPLYEKINSAYKQLQSLERPERDLTEDHATRKRQPASATRSPKPPEVRMGVTANYPSVDYKVKTNELKADQNPKGKGSWVRPK